MEELEKFECEQAGCGKVFDNEENLVEVDGIMFCKDCAIKYIMDNY